MGPERKKGKGEGRSRTDVKGDGGKVSADA